MKSWAVMEFVPPQAANGLSIPSFIQRGIEGVQIASHWMSIYSHRLNQLFDQVAYRNFSRAGNVSGAAVSLVIDADFFHMSKVISMVLIVKGGP